ncbi:MAG TPA: hypothetical protein VIU86_14555, partial [Gaiellaceae bacterium]
MPSAPDGGVGSTEPPDQVEELVRFGNALRREGIRAGTGAVADFCRAATLLPPRDLYWAGRATLVTRHEEIPVYDRVFKSFFALAPAPPRPPQKRVRLVVAGAEQAEGAEQQGDGEAPSVALASRLELLRR